MSFQPISSVAVQWRQPQGNIPVGTLVLSDGRAVFKYEPAFLERKLFISPKHLPNQIDPRLCNYAPFDYLFGVFNDSLPDGWGRLLLDRAIRSKRIDLQMLSPLDRLAFVGDGGVGALTYLPDYGLEEEHPNTYDLSVLAAETQVILQGQSSELIDQFRKWGGGSQGARPKIFADFNPTTEDLIIGQPAYQEDYVSWIIKFASNEDPDHMGRIEYAYSNMAKAAGVEMANCRLFFGQDKSAFFGTQRFDKEGLISHHVHTAAGLLHSTHRLPSLDYGNLIHETLELTRNMSEATKVFRLAAFNLYSFNRDDHSKNFSWMLDLDGNWKVAPAYDLTFSNGPGGQHSTIYAGEGANPTSKQLMELATHFGIKKAIHIIDEVKAAIHNWHLFAEEAQVSEEMTDVVWERLAPLLTR